MKLAGHVARKRFGQNFLVAPGIIERIIAAIAPQAADNVVEIGPGLGALTEPLLARLERLQVIEIDRDLIARLRERFAPERLIIHEGDALSFDFSALGQDLRIVGNLPYNISTPLLFHLARFAAQMRDMHLMLQREVVERIIAAPGSGDYGRLSVALQYRFRTEKLFLVPPGAFLPAPKVESAIVRLIPRPASALAARDEALLGRLITAAFSQRRKMLRNTLCAWLNEEDWQASSIDPTARAENLTVADYVRLTNHLADRMSPLLQNHDVHAEH